MYTFLKRLVHTWPFNKKLRAWTGKKMTYRIGPIWIEFALPEGKVSLAFGLREESSWRWTRYYEHPKVQTGEYDWRLDW
jgi:hypothetical protein